jgi:HEPN domain-containing protein
MKQKTREWIKKAEGDYKIAAREMRTKNLVYDAVCIHAQQCLEKYFKALTIWPPPLSFSTVRKALNPITT